MPVLPDVQTRLKPQLPQVSTAVPAYNGGQAENTLASAQETSANISAQELKRLDAEFADQSKYDLAHARSAFLQGKVALDAEPVTDQNYRQFPDLYRQKLDELRRKLGNSLSGQAQQLFWDDSKLALERGYEAAKKASLGKETDIGRADLNSVTDANLKAALNSSDEQTAASLLIASRDSIDAAESKRYITSQEAEKSKRTLALKYAQGRIGTMDPDAQVTVLSQGMTKKNGHPVFAKTGTYLDFLDPAQRVKMLETAKTQSFLDKERAYRLAERAKKDAQDRTKSGFVARLYQPEQNGGLYTVSDVVNSNMEASDKEHFIDLLKKKASGALDQQFDATVFNNAFAKVAANPYLDINTEILPLLGKGIDPAHFNQIREAADAMRRHDFLVLKPIVDESKSITTSSIFGKDPVGDHNLALFNVDLMQKVIDARSRNVPLSELADPKSKEYVGGLVEHYRPTAMQIIQSKINNLQKLQAEMDKQKAGEPHDKDFIDRMKEFFHIGDQSKPVVAPKSVTINGENYDVIGENPDGSLRIRDPATGRTGTYRK